MIWLNLKIAPPGVNGSDPGGVVLCAIQVRFSDAVWYGITGDH